MKANDILLFTDADDFGGAERAILTLLCALDRDRWRPTIVHHPASGLRPLIDEAGRLGVPSWSVPTMPEGVTGARRLPAFVASLRARGPALIHFHLNWQSACRYPQLGAVLARLRVVATVQVFVETEMRRRQAAEQRLMARAVDRYVAVSNHVRARLVDAMGLPAGKIDVIPNAVDASAFRRRPDPELRARIVPDPADRLILVPARLHPQKGHRHLLQAVGEVPRAFFALAGEGSERQDLEKLAAALGVADRVGFLGYRNDVPNLLAIADLVVLPSLFEGLPLAVLEAMAAGRPVVATRVAGTEELVVSGETGVLVRPADPPALAAAIRDVLDEPEQARRLAEAGRRAVEREFSAAAMTARVSRLYQEVLAGGMS